MLAGVAMALSSLTVVGNSLLLGRYKPRFLVRKAKHEQSILYRNKDEKRLMCSQDDFSMTSTYEGVV